MIIYTWLSIIFSSGIFLTSGIGFAIYSDLLMAMFVLQFVVLHWTASNVNGTIHQKKISIIPPKQENMIHVLV